MVKYLILDKMEKIMDLIKRANLMSQIEHAFKVNRIVCLLGPRQCGKTTIARQLWSDAGKSRTDPGYFDLERPADLQALDNPDFILPGIKGLIVIDEIQRRAELFPYLRYLHDENLEHRFLILGSASRDLINQSSESLAGRISFIEITPFSTIEVPNWQRLWTQGGFPRSYILDALDSMLWRENYMRTYVEQDLAMLGFNFQAGIIQKLWFMLAHYHGQIINYSELAASLGVSHPTIKRYISYLAGGFMLRELKPWHENLQKRQVKSPKVYYRDSGLLHYTFGIKNYEDIFKHHKAGASFEGFALEEVIRYSKVSSDACYFWATHNKAELDLLILKNGKKLGFEFKMSEAPKITPSIKIIIEELNLDSLAIIYPGNRIYTLEHNIVVIPINKLQDYFSNIS
ncbi:MAG: putative superfamily ATPase [Burkholderiales bacterium]|jgi:predicted AAA+ superfamily ATPase|nr:putative superfamily ATPase [Burkholderiales bacterium]